MREALLVAQFHAREVEHAALHGAAAGRTRAGHLVPRRDDAEREVQAGARVADLRAVTGGGPSRKPVEAAPPAHWATFS